MDEVTGHSGMIDTPKMAGGIALLALVVLIFMHRLNVSVSVKA